MLLLAISHVVSANHRTWLPGQVSAFLAYNGELAGDALPGLRRLRFEVVLPLIGPATDVDLLLQDVLRSAARSLREVRLSPYFGLREATIEVRNCAKA